MNRILVFLVGAVAGALLLAFHDWINVCWDTNQDAVLQGRVVKVEQVDDSAKWLSESEIHIYSLPGIKSHRKYQLLLIQIPPQLKGQRIESSFVFMRGLDSSGSADPVSIPALSAQETEQQNTIAILVDCLCRSSSPLDSSPILSSKEVP